MAKNRYILYKTTCGSTLIAEIELAKLCTAFILNVSLYEVSDVKEVMRSEDIMKE